MAKWYGFDLIQNFEHPYLATGPAEFWRRWNISLSTWFRDYVYIPLGGSRRGPWRERRQHHDHVPGLGPLARRQLELRAVGRVPRRCCWSIARARRPRVAGASSKRGWLRPLQVAGMFVLTCVGWLIFRETELTQLWRDLRLSPVGVDRAWPIDAGLYLFLLAGLYSLPLWIHDLWAELGGPSLVTARLTRSEAEVHWRRVATQAVLCGLMMAAILTLRSQTALNFIYFAF